MKDFILFELISQGITWILENVFSLSVESQLGSSIHFFFYDIIKIALLLAMMIFIISYIRSFFPPERTKRIIEKVDGPFAHVLASLLGIVTPFCSCSSVPLFIGFVEAGIPLGVTFSFLITSPIVNEAAFIILLASFGWKIALLYVAAGVVIGVAGGMLIRVLKLEKYVEEYVYQLKSKKRDIQKLDHSGRMSFAFQNVKDIVSRVWLFLIIGIGVGAVIHGWVPEDILAGLAGGNNPLSVLAGVLIGIPLYSNTVGTIPVAEALIAKGVGIGTALAFMMAVSALSLPEMLLLKKVIKPKLIAVFITITGVSIFLVGNLFNVII